MANTVATISQSEESEIEEVRHLLRENTELYKKKRESLQRLQDKYGVVQERNGGITLLLGNEEWFENQTRFAPR